MCMLFEVYTLTRHVCVHICFAVFRCVVFDFGRQTPGLPGSNAPLRLVALIRRPVAKEFCRAIGCQSCKKWMQMDVP